MSSANRRAYLSVAIYFGLFLLFVAIDKPKAQGSLVAEGQQATKQLAASAMPAAGAPSNGVWTVPENVFTLYLRHDIEDSETAQIQHVIGELGKNYRILSTDTVIGYEAKAGIARAVSRIYPDSLILVVERKR